MKPTIRVLTTSRTTVLDGNLTRLRNTEVYVGIPEEENNRPGEDIGNATLMWIHTNGSELQGIPPRPVIEPAIEQATTRDLIADELKQAAQGAMAARPQETTQHLHGAGTLGANAAKRWFTDPENGWPPLSAATILSKGSDRALVDTGELRRSITYVVVEGT